MRALVVEHLRSNPVGLYGDVLAERGIPFDRVLRHEGDALPDWRGHDLLVVMGGGMSAYQQDEHPWLVDEKEAIREAVHAGMPYFGVCLGSQLLASALGAHVYRGSAPELGVNPLLLTEAARRDPVFRGFPSDLEAFEWHCDTFDLPEGAVRLARSPRYENQAFRIGPVAYAIQCHLEPTLEDVREWFTLWPSLLDTFDDRQGAGSVDGFLLDYGKTMPFLHQTARQLFRRWLEHGLALGRLAPRTRVRRAATPSGLLGRTAERACIGALLARAREGRSGALVLRGSAGIGKTSLLDEAAAAAAGSRVVRVSGDLAERDRPYSGLCALCAPFLDLLDAVPEPQAGALRHALGLDDGERGDWLAVSAATLWLLDAGSRSEPLLICVDDMDLLDEESLRVLEFVAGRLDAEGIALIVAADGDDTLLDAGLDEVELSPLPPRAARALLQGSGELVPGVAEPILAVAQGNPLALLAIPASLTSAQRLGEEPLRDALATRSNAEQAFLHRLLALPEPTQRMLLIAGLAATSERRRLEVAWLVAGIDPDALRPAVDGTLVRWDGENLAFVHPLIRSVAVYNSLPSERRAAHAALADTATGPDAHGWHTARATVAMDELAAAELTEAADRAVTRGAHGVAARAFELAARLTPGETMRASRLLAAARAAAAAGHLTAALDHLDSARPLAIEPALRADIDRLHGQLEARRGSARVARDVLVAGAQRRRASDPVQAAAMLADAVIPALRAGSPADAVELARRARDIADSPAARLTHGIALLLSGDYEAGSTNVAAVSANALEASQRPYLGLGLCLAGRAGDASKLLTALAAAARDGGSLAALPYILLRLADVELQTGHWDEAARHLHEAAVLAAESGQAADQGLALGGLAWLHAVRGDEDECCACVADSFALADLLGVGSRSDRAGSALGLLELGRGHADAAIEHFGALAVALADAGWSDAAIPPHRTIDLVAAQAAAGRHADAAATAARFAAEADRVGAPSAVPAAALCRGLAASEPGSEAWLAEALAAPGDLLGPFERARARLALGSVLLAADRTSEANDQLAAAFVAFGELGAAPWTDQARTLLATAGVMVGEPREPVGAPAAADTAVVTCVRSGLSIPETARRLLLTERSVEQRLRRVREPTIA